MSYEVYCRKPYRAKCACGQGFLRFYKIYLSNDWGQEREEKSSVELMCHCCKKKYHYECDVLGDYLVPNGLSFPKQLRQLDRKYNYSDKECFVHKYDKKTIEDMVEDMTAPKHRYIKNLENETAIEFANRWAAIRKNRSLEKMVSYLQGILCEYDSIKKSYEAKKPFRDKYDQEREEIGQLQMQVREQSIRISFQYDSEQDELDRIESKRKLERYEEEHRYDDFQAQVSYDASFKRDLVNYYWDSYFIKKCTDQQYLSLDKPQYGTPKISIAKKYFCVCQICGKEAEIISSDFKISYENERGFYPKTCCSCHTVSSFEAKTMDILNQLGITYIREKAFEGLTGEFGRALRFDFALYKFCEESGIPKIDLVIELQGPHHYKKGYYDEFGEYILDDTDHNIQKNMEDKFARQLRYDEKKKEYCKRHGIELECIKYTVSNDYERLEKKIIEILKKYEYKYYEET